MVPGIALWHLPAAMIAGCGLVWPGAGGCWLLVWLFGPRLPQGPASVIGLLSAPPAHLQACSSWPCTVAGTSGPMSCRGVTVLAACWLGGGRQGSPEDGFGPGACFVGGCAVSFDQGGDGGAFGEEHPLVGDGIGVFGTGCFGQGAEV